MAEDKARKPSQPATGDKAAKKDEEIVIHDSTKQDQEAPEPQQKEELEGRDLGEAPDTTGISDEPKAEPTSTTADAPAPKKKFVWTRKKIILAVVAAVIVILGVLAAIPTTRYAIAGLVVKRDVTLVLHDSKTQKPVSNVAITAAGKEVTTDAKGMATFKSMPVGVKTFDIQKKNYKSISSTQTVDIFGNNPTFDMVIEATGRQVPVTILNKVSQKPLEGATIVADGTSSKTDKNGEAVLVLPANKDAVDADVSSPGYNSTKTSITVTEQKDDKNTFSLTPSGKLYFLSKRSGTIDVLKSDLDGGNIETVLKGTGKEEERDTVLLASRDWKYLALKSTRDSERPKLYLIETATSKLSVMDEGDATFSLVGWSGSHFTYTVFRDKMQDFEPKRYALKSYNASSGVISTLDQTDAKGTGLMVYAAETLGDVYILNNELVYVKSWNFSNVLSGDTLPDGKFLTINSVRPDGSDKKVVKSFAEERNTYLGGAKLYEPQELYFYVSEKGKETFWEYEDDKLAQVNDITPNDFYKYYPTYLVSPSGQKTFWAEPRDGKNTLFVGDKNASSRKEVASLSEYTPYGWYSDGYLLVSKGGSELYIMSVSDSSKVLKVTDYHKPNASFAGYGYGYGGL